MSPNLRSLGLPGAVRYSPRGAFGADTSAAEAYIHERRGLLVFVCPIDAADIVARLEAQAAILYASGEERNQRAVALAEGVVAYVIGAEKAKSLAR